MDVLAIPKDATTDENVKIVHTLFKCDRRRDLIVSEGGIRFGAVQSILTDILGVSNVSPKWMSPMLTDDQKRTWLNISRYLLSRYEYDAGKFIKQVVT